MITPNIFLLVLGLAMAEEYTRVIGDDKAKMPGYLSSSGFINVGPANISIFVINNGEKREDQPKPFIKEELTLDNLLNPFQKTPSGRFNNDPKTKSQSSIFGDILVDEMMNTLNDPGFITFTNKILSSLLAPPRPSRVSGHHHRHPQRPVSSPLSPTFPRSRATNDNPQQMLNSVVKLLSQDLGGMLPKKQPGSDSLMMFEIVGMPEKIDFEKAHPFQSVFPSVDFNFTKPTRIYKDLKKNADPSDDKSANIIVEADRKSIQTEVPELKPKSERIEKEEVTIRTVKKDMADEDIVSNQINTENILNIISKSTEAPEVEIPIVKSAPLEAEKKVTDVKKTIIIS